MIEFIEKERYYDDSAFTGQCWMYPTFMVKDGIEYFMWNRREPDDSWKVKKREGQKAELLANGGAYFHFHGIYADPFEMLAEMERRGHTFTEPDNLFVDCLETGGFVDFHGNRNEVSAAFHYRIYDKALIERIRAAVARIIERSKYSVLTKEKLKLQLQQGHTLNDLLAFGPGQDCEIFKADKFYPGDVVIYVPDVALNHIPLDRPITDQEEFSEVLSNCYTGQDFIDECHGDTEKAERLFCYCDWQHPSSAVDELEDDPGQVEVMLSDLLPEAQKEVMRVLGIRSPAEGNYDVMPLLILTKEES